MGEEVWKKHQHHLYIDKIRKFNTPKKCNQTEAKGNQFDWPKNGEWQDAFDVMKSAVHNYNYVFKNENVKSRQQINAHLVHFAADSELKFSQIMGSGYLIPAPRFNFNTCRIIANEFYAQET